MKELKSYRMSQGLTTYGIGAIIGIGDESFINTGVTNPDEQLRVIFPRLSNRLGVNSLRHPRIKYVWGDKGQINVGNKFSFMRFPSWMFCPSCRAMKQITAKISQDLKGDVPRCDNNKCKGFKKFKLQPVRFVIACEHGHMDEFPWWKWTHSKNSENIADNGNCQNNRLFFRVRQGVGAGWDSLVVKCSCGASRSLSDLNGNPDALKSIGQKCRGKQPWQAEGDLECGETPRVSQRNASNIYQPVIVSAIDIEAQDAQPADVGLKNKIENSDLYNPLIRYFEERGSDDEYFQSMATVLCKEFGCSINEIINTLEPNDANAESISDKPKSIYEINQSLKIEEYSSFFKDIKTSKFINQVEDINQLLEIDNSKLFAKLIGHISLVKKLREVRVFKGFNRLQFDPGKIVSPVTSPDWLPAIEIYGEGIFLALDEDSLNEWYKKYKSSIDSKMDSIAGRYVAKGYEERFGPFHAKFVLLHTLSHLLIRQLSFESGYNASSLRESIYFSDERDEKMLGILIYTADSDSEGSLGGLVRQGQLQRLLPTILLALQKSSWCPSDPVCKESAGQGNDGLNQGACHACSLISETSCSHLNSLLSRSLLIDEDFGYFKDVL